jgi:hypothetical protein
MAESLGRLVERKAAPSPGEVGAELARRIGHIEAVLAVGVTTFGRAVRVRTVIQEYDMGLCGQIFAAEGELYECFPNLEADFLVVDSGDAEAATVLDGTHQDFVWRKRAE